MFTFCFCHVPASSRNFWSQSQCVIKKNTWFVRIHLLGNQDFSSLLVSVKYNGSTLTGLMLYGNEDD